MNNYFKSIIFTFFVAVFIFYSLLVPLKAHAIDVIGGPAQILSTAWEKTIQPALKKAGAVAWRNALNLYLEKMARQSAEWVASGGKGQAPLFADDPDKFLTDMAGDLKGQFISTAGKEILGVSLCDTWDPTVTFGMLVSLDPNYRDMTFDAEIDCSWSKIKENYKEAMKQKLLDFSFDLREGPMAKYKSSIKTLMVGDTVLNKTGGPCAYNEEDGFFAERTDCTGSGNSDTPWVNPGVDRLLDIIGSPEEGGLLKVQEDLQAEISKGADNISPEVLAGLRDDLWYIELNSSRDEDGKVHFSAEPVSRLLNMSKTEFCSDDLGEKFSQWSPPITENCLVNADYQAALIYAKRFHKYVKKLVDWGNTLSDYIEESMPDDEVANLPDTDPLEDLDRMYTPEGSAIGAQMSLSSRMFGEITDEVEGSKFAKELQGRMNDVTTQISNITKTPSTWVDETARKAVKEGSASVKQYTGVALADAFGVFTSTLTNKLLEQAKKGLNPNPSPSSPANKEDIYSNLDPRDGGGSDNYIDDGGDFASYEGGGGEEAAEAFFAGLTTPNIQQVNEYTIYDEFTTFPQEENYTKPFNALIGNQLLRAIEDEYTIKEAMDKGLLSPDTIVGKPNDFTSQLSYPVIKKLRRARIFPLGLEIAAYKIFNKQLPPTTLGAIVGDYNADDKRVVNGSFEYAGYKDEDGGAYGSDELPSGWQLNQFSESPELYETYSFWQGESPVLDYGEKAYKIKASTSSDFYPGLISDRIPVQPGTKYSFEASTYIMSQAGDPNDVSLDIHCINEDNLGAGHDLFDVIISDNTADSSNEWHELSFNIKTNESPDTVPDYCQIFIVFSGNGATTEALFDGVKMVKGGEIPEDYEFSNFGGLVDPNWLLKTPNYKCEAMAYSQTPLPDSSQRQKTCVDLKDCVKENSAGDCLSWGYCLKEKKDWDFQAQACPEYFSSCSSYTRINDGEEFSFLADTISTSSCNETNVGCQWYCNDWSEDQGTWLCETPGVSLNYEDDSNYIENPSNAIFLNRNVSTCPASAVGCNEYIDASLGNLISNSSFETLNADDLPKYWDIDSLDWVLDSGQSYDGDIAILMDDGPSFYPKKEINIVPNTNYTLSLKAQAGGEGEGELITGLYFYSKNGSLLEPSIGDESVNTGDALWDVSDDLDDSNLNYYYSTKTVKAGYRTYDFTFKALPQAKSIKIALGENSGNSIIIDQLQLYQGKDLKNYKEYGADQDKVYLQNADSCDLEDLGCQLYTKENGTVSISAVINDQDKCPSECLGFESFLEMPTNFDTSSEWQNFIPETGTECNSPGCESFTNLAEVEKGGESNEYYTYLRKCLILPEESGQCNNYYTWVGSDTTGYQLKRYQLKKSVNGGPARIEPYSDAQIKWGKCEDETDLLNNAHCREFYDSNENKYFRIYENTITCSEDCVQYRRDKDGTELMALPQLSKACSESDVGCRQYKGLETSKTGRVLFNDFEFGVDSNWSAGNNSNISLSSESLAVSGHSLKVDKKSGAIRGQAFYDVSNLVNKKNTYNLSLWVKGTSSITIGFSSRQEENIQGLNPLEWDQIDLGNIIFENGISDTEKLRIESQAGEFYIDNLLLESGSSLSLLEDSWQTPESCTIDDVGCSLYSKEGENQSYYLKSFNHLCQEEKVGCTPFIDTKNYESPLEKEFDLGENEDIDLGENEDEDIDLKTTIEANEMVYLVNAPEKQCQENYKGCQKLGEPSLGLDGSVTGWKDVYLTNNPDLYSTTRTTNSILCGNAGLYCEAFEDNIYFKDPTKTQKVCEYKQIKSNAMQSDEYGWFKKGTNEACYIKDDGKPYIAPNSSAYGILKADDPEYKGFVGECPENEIGCTDFKAYYKDGDNITERSFYNIDDNRLDRSSCSGKVSRSSGCVLFSNPNITDINGEVINRYNSFATYKKAEDLNHPVAPISCSSEYEVDCSNQDNKDTDYCKYCEEEGEVSVNRGVHEEGETSNTLEGNNTNDIIHVSLDRTCGEWLTCVLWRMEWNSNTNSYNKVCERVARCDTLTGEECSHVVDSGSEGFSKGVLTESKYRNRDMSWNGMDYSGLSIFNMRPVETLFINQDNKQLSYSYDEGSIGLLENDKMVAKGCQAYPEKDSPFTQDVQDDYYNDVNFCEEEEGDCQCNYQKAIYGGLTQYYGDDENVPDAVCTSGGDDVIGIDCDNKGNQDDDCNDGFCQGLTSLITARGNSGYCLETDPSKPEELESCITWWPGQSIADASIIENSAAYMPQYKYYCIDEELMPTFEFFEFQSADPIDKMDNWQEFIVSSEDCFTVNEDLSATFVYDWTGDYDINKDDIENIVFDYTFNEEGDGGCYFSHLCNANLDQDINTITGENGEIDTYILDDNNDFSYSRQCTERTLGDEYITEQDRVRIRALFDPTDEYNLVRFAVNFLVTESSSAATLSFKINSAAIHLKSGDSIELASGENIRRCNQIVKVDTDSNGVASVLTNRINNVADYSSAGESVTIFDGKSYETGCEPWGALELNSDPQDLITIQDNVCSEDEGTLWSSDEELKNIIPNTEKGFEWDSDSSQFEVNNDITWDENITIDSIDPKIAAKGFDGTTDTSQYLHHVTVNDEFDQDINTEKGALLANLSFYAWVDKNKMPIRRIWIDWFGDGSIDIMKQDLNVVAKNRKPVCCESDEACDDMLGTNIHDSLQAGLNFANIPNSCIDDDENEKDTQYFKFQRYLYCNGEDSIGWEEHGCQDACCFKPRVFVFDNFDNNDSGSFDGIIRVEPIE